MQLFTPVVNTCHMQHTYQTLKKLLPSILRAECFNDDNLPFYKEVRRTEIGHLFEHIMLEYLCIGKISQGHSCVAFEGLTKWNWKKDTRGTFHIYINVGYKDFEIFHEALGQSIQLLKTILRPFSVPSSISLNTSA